MVFPWQNCLCPVTNLENQGTGMTVYDSVHFSIVSLSGEIDYVVLCMS